VIAAGAAVSCFIVTKMALALATRRARCDWPLAGPKLAGSIGTIWTARAKFEIFGDRIRQGLRRRCQLQHSPAVLGCKTFAEPPAGVCTLRLQLFRLQVDRGLDATQFVLDGVDPFLRGLVNGDAKSVTIGPDRQLCSWWEPVGVARPHRGDLGRQARLQIAPPAGKFLMAREHWRTSRIIRQGDALELF
jgi:hypothetical protein